MISRNFIFGVIFALSSIANASWVSSGGESFRLEKNPWFLRNVDTVKYCIAIDRAGISASGEVIESAIKYSLQYWKNELKLNNVLKGFTPVGTQDFVQQAGCDNTTDIEFKFGYDTLSSAPDNNEIGFLKDPTSYIGVTIRKEYDEVNLRGRGVIFISSDRGAHPYKNSGNLVTEAWSKPKLLTYALIHELGHVMGIAHLGAGVMSETFLTNLLNSSGFTFYSGRPFISMTKPLQLAEVCVPDMSGNSFDPNYFGMDSAKTCMKLEKKDPAASEWTVYGRSTRREEPPVELGTLKVTESGPKDMSPKPFIYIYLPEGQKVFKSDELGFSEYLVGAVVETGSHQGIFTKVGTHKPNHVQILNDPEALVVTGVVQEQVQPVFSFKLPTLKGIVFP